MTVDITLKKFVSTKKENSSKGTVPEVWISQDISTIQDNYQGKKFHGYIKFAYLGENKCLYVVDMWELRYQEEEA